MNIKLYHAPFTCARVTLNALEEAGVAYQLNMVNMFVGANKKPEYLAVNPWGKVPALVVDGKLLTENAAILTYIAELAPGAGLFPKLDDAFARAKMMSDLIWCTATLHPAVRQLRAPARFTVGETEPVQVRGREYIVAAFDVLEARFGESAWWYDGGWSILDVYFWWLTGTVASTGFDMSVYPAIGAHGGRVMGRASFQRALDRERAGVAAAGIILPEGMRI